MNRRDFIGAAIGALVAALLLPFEEFAAWCKRWLNSKESVLLVGRWAAANFEAGMPIAFNEDGAFAGINRGSNTARYVTGRVTNVDRLRGTITVSA